MMDRGMIKWEPFNSVIPSSKVIKDVINEKNKIKKPILSEEQLKNIEQKLIDSYNSKENIIISYFQNGYILNEEGIIKKIDYINKKVYLDYKIIYFSQITDIS